METTAWKTVPLVAWTKLHVLKLQPNGRVICHVRRISNVWVKSIWIYCSKIKILPKYLKPWIFWSLIFLYTGYYCTQKIDLDHLKTTPTCGMLSGVIELPGQSSSRISNAKSSDVYYPWVVFVERKYSNGNYKKKVFLYRNNYNWEVRPKILIIISSHLKRLLKHQY